VRRTTLPRRRIVAAVGLALAASIGMIDTAVATAAPTVSTSPAGTDAARPQGSNPDSASVLAVDLGPPITRSEIIARADTWMHPPVPYSQDAYKGGYRTDCSGYVSMAWIRPACRSTTTTCAPANADPIHTPASHRSPYRRPLNSRRLPYGFEAPDQQPGGVPRSRVDIGQRGPINRDQVAPGSQEVWRNGEFIPG
jgi:hypothetical protein